jgi:two-component sensor histidine kinase
MSALTAELQQKNQQLAALHEISRTIARAQNLDDTLELITRRAAEVMQADSCSIYLYNQARDRLVLAATTGLNKSEVKRASLPDGVGLTGWAAAQRQTIAVSDAFADVRFVRVPGSGESKFPSLLAMPLVSRDKVIGAANVQTIKQHTFTPAEQELFSLITELAAIALDKAQRVHSALVQEMHHRVKNNLQTIAMLLRLQLADSAGLSPQDILPEAINRVLSIATVHEILSETGVDKVSALDLIRRVTDSVSAAMLVPAAVISLTVSGDDILLPAQRATGLALIANELVQNALEHGLSGRSEGRIIITLIHRDSQLRLRVEDDGCGLPPNFNPDSDLGLGLEIVRATVTEDMNGKFSIGSNRRGPGTHTQVTLPVPV